MMTHITTANIMKKYNNPKWWNQQYDSSWDRVKDAFKRDWEQTKHDFGGNEPDLKQNANDTVKQAAGKAPMPKGQPNYDDLESSYRFGYGAREHYSDKYSDWDDDLETQLRSDWESANPNQRETWMQERAAIRRGWDFDYDEDEEVVTADR
jgi:hypothetical protein